MPLGSNYKKRWFHTKTVDSITYHDAQELIAIKNSNVH